MLSESPENYSIWLLPTDLLRNFDIQMSFKSNRIAQDFAYFAMTLHWISDHFAVNKQIAPNLLTVTKKGPAWVRLRRQTGIFRLENSRPAIADASSASITMAPSRICLMV